MDHKICEVIGRWPWLACLLLQCNVISLWSNICNGISFLIDFLQSTFSSRNLRIYWFWRTKPFSFKEGHNSIINHLAKHNIWTVRYQNDAVITQKMARKMRYGALFGPIDICTPHLADTWKGFSIGIPILIRWLNFILGNVLHPKFTVFFPTLKCREGGTMPWCNSKVTPLEHQDGILDSPCYLVGSSTNLWPDCLLGSIQKEKEIRLKGRWGSVTQNIAHRKSDYVTNIN